MYAAGDCAEAEHVVTGEPAYVPLALTANRHGRAIGQTVAGEPTEAGGIAGTAAVKAFDGDRPSARVLGASLVSEYGEGAVHRSHAVVGAVTEGITVDELSNYDLAYAPPFNTTWDPVLTAAKVVEDQP